MHITSESDLVVPGVYYSISSNRRVVRLLHLSEAFIDPYNMKRYLTETIDSNMRKLDRGGLPYHVLCAYNDLYLLHYSTWSFVLLQGSWTAEEVIEYSKAMEV